MRTNHSALIALNTFRRIPLGNKDRYAALFIGCRADGIGAVLHGNHAADGHLVTFQTIHRNEEVFDISRDSFLRRTLHINSVSPCVGNINFYQFRYALFNRFKVHFHDVVALFAVRHLHRVFQIRYGVFNGNNVG